MPRTLERIKAGSATMKETGTLFFRMEETSSPEEMGSEIEGDDFLEEENVALEKGLVIAKLCMDFGDLFRRWVFAEDGISQIRAVSRP